MAEEVSQDGLVKGVFYEADYIIDVRGLDSGGSRDVHGQVRTHYICIESMKSAVLVIDSADTIHFTLIVDDDSCRCCMDRDTCSASAQGKSRRTNGPRSRSITRSLTIT